MPTLRRRALNWIGALLWWRGTAVNIDHIRRQLIESAVDYLKSSVEAFDNKPKRSIVDFAVATELFIKARLLAEHWILLVADRRDPDAEEFLAGDFQSVTVDSAFIRLKKVLQEGLDTEQLKCFKNVSVHRNKAVHFYHEALNANASDALKKDIASEQSLAWYHLERLLTNRWKPHFKDYLDVKTLDECREAMKKQRQYLSVVFDKVKNIIEANKALGHKVFACSVCGYAACSFQKPDANVMSTKCLVCGTDRRMLSMPCPSGCGERVQLNQAPSYRCRACNTRLSTQEIDILAKEHAEAHDPDGMWWLTSQTSLPCSDKLCAGSVRYNSGFESYCEICKRYVTPEEFRVFLKSPNYSQSESMSTYGECLCNTCGSESSVLHFEGEYICMHCTAIHKSLISCDVCGYTGTLTYDYDGVFRCSVCGGREEQDRMRAAMESKDDEY